MLHASRFHAQAERSLENAKKILTVSYPFTNDPKLFTSVIDRLYNSWINGLRALGVQNNTTAKSLNVKLGFSRGRFSQRHKVPQRILRTFDTIMKIKQAREESPMEFRRKQTFVICSPSLQFQRLDKPTVQSHVARTEEFLQIVRKGVPA